jgi:hypothetical protein
MLCFCTILTGFAAENVLNDQPFSAVANIKDANAAG